MNDSQSQPATIADLAQDAWILDPKRSSVEFHVRHFYGLMTVKGRFASYQGTLELAARPAVQLTIQAASLDTGNARRDKHLRSADFFDVEHHPEVSFLAETATLEGNVLKAAGELHAAGQKIPLAVAAQLRTLAAGGLEIDAAVEADHRVLGMTWSPLGILRAPSKLIVRGSLLQQTDAAQTARRP
ncbi:MAG: YceI family protein [Solirubrobacteraceae bacterium]